MERYLNKVNVTFTMARIAPSGRFIKKPVTILKEVLIPTELTVQQSKEYNKQKAEYDKQQQKITAYNEALTHFEKGKAQLYLMYIKGDTPERKLIRGYLKEFVKQEKAGNIMTQEKREKEYKKVQSQQATVVIDGQGYTVKPELQEEFIKKTQKTTPAKNKFTEIISKPSKFEKAIKTTLVPKTPEQK